VSAVPLGANEVPHVPDSQVRLWHSVSTPGQSLALVHWAQLPMPSQQATQLPPQQTPPWQDEPFFRDCD
jgi:hypothetical protein